MTKEQLDEAQKKHIFDTKVWGYWQGWNDCILFMIQRVSTPIKTFSEIEEMFKMKEVKDETKGG